jgi:hypothetical protein
MGENKYIIYEWVIIISLEHRQWHSLLEWSAVMQVVQVARELNDLLE